MLLLGKAKNRCANVKKTTLLIYIHCFSTTDADVGTENILELLEQRKKKPSDILPKLKPSLQPVSTFIQFSFIRTASVIGTIQKPRDQGRDLEWTLLLMGLK